MEFEDPIKKFLGYISSRKFMLPYCGKCDKYIYPPRNFCPFCGSRNLEWREISGRGKLYAFTTNPDPILFPPGVLGIVELDEGVKVLSRIDGKYEDLKIGMPVRLDFMEVTVGREKMVVHKFVPVKEEGG
ncbi:MAG: Zn-ribbon domain-containing OB-fold protein [Candidatus Baldrarchaeia archaeon]